MPILQWLTRNKDVESASQVSYRVLEEIQELGCGELTAKNMLIHGNNLEALKSLLPYFAGYVKCIYIDPPYNTGSAFEHYDDNLEHTLWLSIMMARLQLLRDFLKPEGTIWIQIDDEQQAYLKVICDEVFGRKNFIATLCVKMSHLSGVKMSHKTKNFPKLKEYILVYAKSKESLELNSQYEKCSWDEAFDRYDSFIIKDDKKPDDISLWKRISLGKALRKAGIKHKKIDKNDKNVFNFCMQHADCIFRTARIKSSEFLNLPNDDKFRRVTSSTGLSKIAYKREEVLVCSEKLKIIDGVLTPALPVGDMWGDAGINNLHNEGGVSFKKGKKPERLIRKILSFATNPGDLVMDSFLGSGTTAAVAHKMGRQYIGIEMGNHCITHCQRRLASVVKGEQSGISRLENWHGGGGFRFYQLGETIFKEDGEINPSVSFSALASHIWFTETYTPLAIKEGYTTLLGIHNKTAYSLLYNGILKDRSVASGNVLTRKTLDAILKDIGTAEYDKIIVYGESCRLGAATLSNYKIQFKQTPYDVRA